VLIRAGGDFDKVSRVVVPQVRSDVRRTIHRPLHGYVSGYADVANGIHNSSVDALKHAELIAAPLLLLVLMLVFRSPVAASIPLMLGLTTISAMGGVLELVNHVKQIDVVALNMGSMMGLALGVDYSLVMVSRFREELASGADPREAVRRTGLTAGRTVKFAGLALVVAMVGAAFVAPGGILMSSGIGTITATAVSVVGAATALPAILVLLGSRVDRWSFGRSHTSDSRWGSAALSMIRRPALAGGLVLALLLGLAAPALALDMGSPDPRDLPAKAPERHDFDAIYHTLAGGWTAPYEIVVASKKGPITDPGKLAALDRWQRTVARDPKVKAVMGPAPIARRSRQAQRTGRQLQRLRSQFANGGQGLDRLSSGLGRLERGVALMRGGLGDAAVGASRLEQGGAAAADGVTRLAGGLTRARAGAATLTAALAQTRTGSERLRKGVVRARGGTAELLQGLRTARTQTAAGIPQIDKLEQGLRQGSRDLASLREPAQLAARQLTTAKTALDDMAPTSKLDPNYRTAYEAVARASGAVTGRNPLDGNKVRAGYDGLDSALAGASGAVATAADGAARMRGQTGRLATGLSRLERGSRRIDRGLGRLAAGAAHLRRALGRLGGGSGRLAGGLGSLERGGATLGAGVARLRDGAGRLGGGLDSGVSRSAALQGGVRQMRTGVAGVRTRTKALRGPGLNTRVFDSGYLTLAGMDVLPHASRAASTFAVNLDRGGSATRVAVVEKGDPTNAGDPLRGRLEREAKGLRKAGMTAAVGGPAATLQDFDGAATSRLLPLVLLLVLVTYLVLVPVLRSLVLPLLAVLLNVLTVAAAFGLLTLGFEGSAPLGGSGQLDAIMVLAIFGIVFALSIDYEVFLLARIREGYAVTGSTEGAIDYGLRRTAGVITGAALIMTGVFVAFALSDIASMRQLGVGLSVAVLLDATLVRLVLLPAAIRLAGRANWWLPAWLDRVLPQLDVEGGAGSPAAAFANGNGNGSGRFDRDQVAEAVQRFVGTRREKAGR
jgi:RND superfamily putative drug exporter